MENVKEWEKYFRLYERETLRYWELLKKDISEYTKEQERSHRLKLEEIDKRRKWYYNKYNKLYNEEK